MSHKLYLDVVTLTCGLLDSVLHQDEAHKLFMQSTLVVWAMCVCVCVCVCLIVICVPGFVEWPWRAPR